MPQRWSAGLPALAAVAVVVVSSGHLVVGRLLRYATLGLSDRPIALLALPVIAAALVHELLVRGRLYAALRSRLAPGLGAPAVAAIGALVPSAVRLAALPRGNAPFAILAAHAYLVEFFLGLGLAWLALGAGNAWPAGFAMAGVWLVRLAVDPVFHGGVLPLLEMLAALVSALAVAGILFRPLASHRAAVMEES